jgi:hypothetical protein
VPPNAGGRVAPAAALLVAVSFAPSQPARSPADGIAAVLQGAPQIGKRSSIRVFVQNETAILRGEVATPHDRELAENLARFEPGIWDVKNEIVVRSPANVAAANTRPAAGR